MSTAPLADQRSDTAAPAVGRESSVDFSEKLAADAGADPRRQRDHAWFTTAYRLSTAAKTAAPWAEPASLLALVAAASTRDRGSAGSALRCLHNVCYWHPAARSSLGASECHELATHLGGGGTETLGAARTLVLRTQGPGAREAFASGSVVASLEAAFSRLEDLLDRGELLRLAFHISSITPPLPLGGVPAAAAQAFVQAQLGTPCPMSDTLKYAAALLIHVGVASLSKETQQALVNPAARVTTAIIMRYVDPTTGAPTAALAQDKVGLEDMLEPVICLVYALATKDKAFQDALHRVFFPDGEKQQGSNPEQLRHLMCSAAFPRLPRTVGLAMLAVCEYNADELVRHFGIGPCAGLMVALNIPTGAALAAVKPTAPMPTPFASEAEAEQESERIWNAIGRLEALGVMRTTNPLEQAHASGYLDQLEARSRQEEQEQEEQEDAEAQHELDAWRLRRAA